MQIYECVMCLSRGLTGVTVGPVSILFLGYIGYSTYIYIWSQGDLHWCRQISSVLSKDGGRENTTVG